MSEKEVLTYSHYVTYKYKPSRYDKHGEVRTEERMICPRCRTYRPVLEHGEKGKCEGCNLHMQRHGNALTVWE